MPGKGLTSIPDIKILAALERSFHQQYPQGFTVMTLVRQEDATTKPSAEVLREAAALSGEFDQVVRLNAIVIEARGLAGSMVRTIVSGVNMMSRAKSVKVFGSIEEALDASAKIPGQDPNLVQDKGEIAAALRRDLWKAAA